MSEIENTQEQKPKISKLALTSFIFGIFGLVCFLGMNDEKAIIAELIFACFTGVIRSFPVDTFYIFRFLCISSLVISLIFSILAFGKIKKSKGLLRGETFAGFSFFISAGILIFFAYVYLMISLFGFPTPD